MPENGVGDVSVEELMMEVNKVKNGLQKEIIEAKKRKESCGESMYQG